MPKLCRTLQQKSYVRLSFSLCANRRGSYAQRAFSLAHYYFFISLIIQGMLVYRSIKSYYCKQMKRKTNALITMVTCYRRKFVADWFREVVEKFKDCATMSPDYGRSLEWPKPPPAMIVSQWKSLQLLETITS